MRGSGWATDWPTAVQGLHELTHAADILLRKGAGLILLLAQEKPTIRRNALARQGNKSSRSAGSQAADGRAAPPCAVPLRLAALASVGQRTEEHSLKHPRKSNAMKKEFHKIISGQHIRVATRRAGARRRRSNELPWVRSACAPQLRRSCAVNSLSQSNLPEVAQYIAAQEQHHEKMSFQDELRALLGTHDIEWDERYVWD